MALEDEMLTNWRQQLAQQQQSSSGRGTAGGGVERQAEVVMEDNNNTTADSETDSDSERRFREAIRQEKYRKKKRKHGGGGDDGGGPEDVVPGNIPIDVLRRISPLCEKIGITMRQQLAVTMGFVELSGELRHILRLFTLNVPGVDSTRLEMSLSTAWRTRRSDAEQVSSDEITSFMESVEQSGSKILVQFDEKDLEHDIDGKVQNCEQIKFELLS